MLTKEYLKNTLGDWVKIIPYDLLAQTIENISKDAATHKVYPASSDVFKAFSLTPFRNLKVVILGQDPYHDGSADGLAFSNSTKRGLRPSPSLRNILKEVERDVYNGLWLDQNPDLTRWAEQGVLLLNTSLTVREKQAESHLRFWEKFTETLLRGISDYSTGVIYLLWGKKAQYYKRFINEKTNYVLEAGHPSPLNRANPFVGCGHFSKVNEILKSQDQEQIIW